MENELITCYKLYGANFIINRKWYPSLKTSLYLNIIKIEENEFTYRWSDEHDIKIAPLSGLEGFYYKESYIDLVDKINNLLNMLKKYEI